MDRPFPAYKGDELYIFVSYSHKDAPAVFPELTRLRGEGFNIWFDEGIEAGTEWREEIGKAILSAGVFLYFVSQEAVLSANCRKEVGLADKQQIPTIAIHLEYTELPAGLDLTLSDLQAIHKYEVPKQEYQQKLQARISSYLDQPTIQPVVVKRKETVPILTGPDNSIAVLPFVNMSSDPEQEFFSDGITEEILNSLASVAELQVTGRTSSFAFKGKNDDLRHIGVALGVKYILEGSVRKSGIKVRITAQLINVENGFRLWSDTFDRELTDIFAIQDEIASKILVQ
ncbi:MAG: TIR domain-containing protein, partial [Proteobacteria bacterium]|nr:TIR domain-containing protein [Pseudomonadota bacterium]